MIYLAIRRCGIPPSSHNDLNHPISLSSTLICQPILTLPTVLLKPKNCKGLVFPNIYPPGVDQIMTYLDIRRCGSSQPQPFPFPQFDSELSTHPNQTAQAQELQTTMNLRQRDDQRAICNVRKLFFLNRPLGYNTVYTTALF